MKSLRQVKEHLPLGIGGKGYLGSIPKVEEELRVRENAVFSKNSSKFSIAGTQYLRQRVA